MKSAGSEKSNATYLRESGIRCGFERQIREKGRTGVRLIFAEDMDRRNELLVVLES